MQCKTKEKVESSVKPDGLAYIRVLKYLQIHCKGFENEDAIFLFLWLKSCPKGSKIIKEGELILKQTYGGILHEIVTNSVSPLTQGDNDLDSSEIREGLHDLLDSCLLNILSDKREVKKTEIRTLLHFGEICSNSLLFTPYENAFSTGS